MALDGVQVSLLDSSGGDSAPCLIGRYDVENDIPRFSAFSCDDGSVYSCDSVRASIRFDSVADVEGFHLRFQMHFSSVNIHVLTCSRTPGRYRWLYTFPLSEDGSVSASIGLGFIDGKCKEHPEKGFVDFNPNKCARYPLFWDLLHYLGGFGLHSDLVRWDLAVDLPGHRSGFHLFRSGKRSYRMDVSNSVTEYLGARNSVGRFKLYDKSGELLAKSGLSVPPTVRAELTLGADFSDVARLWPLFGGVGSLSLESLDSLTPTMRFCVLACVELLDAQQPVEHLLGELTPHVRPKIRRLLCSSPVRCCLPAAHEVFKVAGTFADARTWPELFASSFC